MCSSTMSIILLKMPNRCTLWSASDLALIKIVIASTIQSAGILVFSSSHLEVSLSYCSIIANSYWKIARSVYLAPVFPSATLTQWRPQCHYTFFQWRKVYDELRDGYVYKHVSMDWFVHVCSNVLTVIPLGKINWVTSSSPDSCTMLLI